MVWSILKVSGSLISNVAQWHLLKVSGSTAKQNRWHLLKVSGAPAPVRRWHLLRVSGLIPVIVAPPTPGTGNPLVAAQGPLTADPVAPFTITATTSNNVAPDSWAFSISPATPFVQTGASIALSPPGSLSGATLTVTVTATKGANTSPPATITVNVAPANVWSVDAQGNLHAHSSRYSVKG